MFFSQPKLSKTSKDASSKVEIEIFILNGFEVNNVI